MPPALTRLLPVMSSDPGQGAADAARTKRSTYIGISNTYEIQHVAVENFGVCGPVALSFLRKVGRKAADRRHEPRER